MAALRKKKFESCIKKEKRRDGDDMSGRSSTPPPAAPGTNNSRNWVVGESGESRIGGGDDPAGSPGTAAAAAAAVSPQGEAKPPAKGASGAARIPNRSSSSSEERRSREERAKTSLLLVNGSSEDSSGVNNRNNHNNRNNRNNHNNNNTTTSSSNSSSSDAGHLGGGPPQTQTAPATKAAGGPSEGGPAPKDSPGEKAREREKLREQLQKLVSNKLSTLGDLDHAGLVALEALSKMPPPPGTPGARQPGSPTTGGNAPGGTQRPRKNLPPGLEKVPRFTGKNLAALTDTLTRFHSLVVGALPGSSLQAVNRALLRDVVFILEGSALKFYDALKDGQIQWEPVPPIAGSAAAAAAAATEHQVVVPARAYFQPPSTWAQVCEAFHDHYLPAEGVARTAATLLSLSQAPGESVRSLAARQLGLTNHLSRLIASDGGRTSFWDAMSIGLFERALRLDLQRMQNAESPCSSFENSVNRAERNAALAESTVNSKEGSGGGGGGGTAVQEAGGGGRIAVTVAVKEQGGSGSDGNLELGKMQAHVHPAAVSPSGLEQQQQQQQTSFRPSSDGVGGSAGVPSVSAAAVAGEAVAKNAGNKKRAYDDDLVTVKCEGADTGTDSKLPDMMGYGKDGNRRGGGSFLEDGEAGSDLFDGDGRHHQPFEDGPDGAMMPMADDDGWRQESSGGRDRNGDFRDSREREPNNLSLKRNNSINGRRSNPNERKRPRGDWHQGSAAGGGGGHPARPWQQRPFQGDLLVGDRPPCTVPQCKAINRQFHCANDCYYHPEHGKFNRSRGGGKRRPNRANLEAEYDGYNNSNSNNFGFQRGPYTDSFGQDHFY